MGGNAISAFLSWRLQATTSCDVTLVWKSGFEAVAQYGVSFKYVVPGDLQTTVAIVALLTSLARTDQKHSEMSDSSLVMVCVGRRLLFLRLFPFLRTSIALLSGGRG